MKKTNLIVGGLIIILLLGVIAWNTKPTLEEKQDREKELGLATSEFRNYATDVVGTKTGTTTVGVDFSVDATSAGQTSTSSYISLIGNRNIAVYTVKVLKASSTSNLVFDFQGSNDDYCSKAVATSTTDALYTDIPLISDINWYSAGDHLRNKVHSTSIGNASSTASFGWVNPSIPNGNEIILTDLNYRCLKLNVSGSSTVMWAQIRTR